MRHAYCRSDFRFREYCYWIPAGLFYLERYEKLSLRACFLYGYLLHAQILAGTEDKNGYMSVRYPKRALTRILRCSQKEVGETLTELSEKGAGLISYQDEKEDKLRIYVRDYTRPILPPRARRKAGIR